MKKIQTWLLSCFLLLSGILQAQQLSPSVVSTSGGFYSNSSGMLSFTTGEMAAVGTYTNISILTQGFQQVWDFGTSVNHQPETDFSFDIYPNPTAGIFKLTYESALSKEVMISILDILGREIHHVEFHPQSSIHIEYFDLSHVTQGIYLVALKENENTHSRGPHTLIRKIQIVR